MVVGNVVETVFHVYAESKPVRFFKQTFYSYIQNQANKFGTSHVSTYIADYSYI
jgi:hypothetical protein